MVACSYSTEVLLLGSTAPRENVKFPVIRFFTFLSAMSSYVSANIKKKDTFVLFVPHDMIQELINDMIYGVAQVRVIYVYCDNGTDLKQAKECIQDEHKKLRFFHKRQLQIKLEKVMNDDAFSTSTSINRTAKNDVASSHEQRISAKRSNTPSHYSSESKRFATTSEHGFSAGNMEQIELRWICPSCKLVLRSPYQLNCGHRVCQSCLNINNK